MNLTKCKKFCCTHENLVNSKASAEFTNVFWIHECLVNAQKYAEFTHETLVNAERKISWNYLNLRKFTNIRWMYVRLMNAWVSGERTKVSTSELTQNIWKYLSARKSNERRTSCKITKVWKCTFKCTKNVSKVIEFTKSLWTHKCELNGGSTNKLTFELTKNPWKLLNVREWSSKVG